MRVYLLAGEPSGDKLGGALMSGLKSLSPKVKFRGVGGPMMAEQGLKSLFPMDELSVMGIAEVLPKYPELKRRLNETVEHVLASKPDVLITIDSPDFSLRLAKQVKERSDIRTVHYVAPSVWAWRASRAEKMSSYIDQVLALLPFEPPYMEKAGIRCDFVGHPIVSEPIASEVEAAAFRRGKGLGDAPLIMVLPGSRRAEVSRLSPIFGEALRQTLKTFPQARVVVPAAEPVASAVIDATTKWPGAPVVLDPRGDPQALRAKRAAFAAADVALAASGTVSLELAANNTPMVIAYDMNWFSWQIMSRLAKIDTVTLVNLVTEQNVVPEFLGPKCTPQNISDALVNLMDDQAKRWVQQAAMTEAMKRLGAKGEDPGLRAAHAVLDGLGA